MTTPATTWGSRVIGEGMARPVVVYLLLVGSFAFIPASGRGGDVLAFLVMVALAFAPPLIVNAELVRRYAMASWPRRTFVGAASWASWCLFVALVAVFISRVAFVPRELLGPVTVSAAVGAAFSVIAFRGREPKPGIALTLLAVLVVGLVVVGAVWMAGRWGGPV